MPDIVGKLDGRMVGFGRSAFRHDMVGWLDGWMVGWLDLVGVPLGTIVSKERGKDEENRNGGINCRQ